MQHDIQPLLDEWPHEPGEVQVREVGADGGYSRLHMRVDLGLLQFEKDGRPDGQRPFGHDSLLDYHRQRLKDYVDKASTDAGFELTPEECVFLRQEGLQYYYRYLSCFHLKDYSRVVRDTDRNLQLFDFIGEYAAEEDDQTALEPYRPYVVMMHTRARAELACSEDRLEDALTILLEGVEVIRTFLESIDRADMIEDSAEIADLRDFYEEIIANMAEDPLVTLREKMQNAIATEDYESAALLRDEIRRLTEKRTGADDESE